MGADRTDRLSFTAGGGEPSFAEFIRRVRAGDERAAAELVERHEPAIRRAVRVGATRGCRLIESVDICQSVLATFFVRAALGQYDLENPDQLLKLLATIARNKLAGQANREHADRRDQRRINPGAVIEECLAPGSSPSHQVSKREIVQEARRRMTPKERDTGAARAGFGMGRDRRGDGGGPDALRICWSRAVARITRELGLDEGLDE